MTDTTHATPEEYRRLFELMKQIQDLAPWDWMEEIDLFGIQNPDTGDLGFVSIMGSLGEHFAVAVYQGTDGLYGFWKMQEAGPFLKPEDIFNTPQLQASFEDREMINKFDHDMIKKSKLKFRGRNAWPQFRSLRRGYAPWHIDSSEARFLAYALEQTLIVAPRINDDFDIIEFDNDDQYLVRVAEKVDDNLIWRDKVMSIEPPEPIKLDITIDDRVIQAVAKLPRRNYIVEADFFMIMSMITEEVERPYFPYMLLMIDSTHKLIMAPELLQPNPSLEDMWSSLGTRILELLLRIGSSPKEIRIRHPLLYASLEPYMKKLKLKIKLVNSMPTLDYFRMDLEQFMG